MQDRTGPATLDIVIPIFNEERVLEPLLGSLAATFNPEARARCGLSRVRYLFVDDGSTDRSAEILAGRIRAGLPAALFRFSRNFGHQSAVSAGLDQADADAVAVIDADLQDPPEVIPAMLERWRQGFDVVYGLRRNRKENALKRAAYAAFYRMVAFLSEVPVPLDSGDFGLMDRRVVEALRALPEKLRFPRGLRAWVGFRQTGVEYDRPARRAGQTKYTLAKLYRLATDGIASLSTRPLKVAQVFSVTWLLLTTGLLVWLLLSALLAGDSRLSTPTLIGYVLIALGNGVQSFCIYILGAYVGRTYLEVKGRPAYLIAETVRPGTPGSGEAVG